MYNFFTHPRLPTPQATRQRTASIRHVRASLLVPTAVCIFFIIGRVSVRVRVEEIPGSMAGVLGRAPCLIAASVGSGASEASFLPYFLYLYRIVHGDLGLNGDVMWFAQIQRRIIL